MFKLGAGAGIYKSLLDVMGHGEINEPCFVVPFEVYAAKHISPPIRGDVIMITKGAE